MICWMIARPIHIGLCAFLKETIPTFAQVPSISRLILHYWILDTFCWTNCRIMIFTLCCPWSNSCFWIPNPQQSTLHKLFYIADVFGKTEEQHANIPRHHNHLFELNQTLMNIEDDQSVKVSKIGQFVSFEFMHVHTTSQLLIVEPSMNRDFIPDNVSQEELLQHLLFAWWENSKGLGNYLPSILHCPKWHDMSMCYTTWHSGFIHLSKWNWFCVIGAKFTQQVVTKSM